MINYLNSDSLGGILTLEFVWGQRGATAFKSQELVLCKAPSQQCPAPCLSLYHASFGHHSLRNGATCRIIKADHFQTKIVINDQWVKDLRDGDGERERDWSINDCLSGCHQRVQGFSNGEPRQRPRRRLSSSCWTSARKWSFRSQWCAMLHRRNLIWALSVSLSLTSSSLS